MAYQQVTLATLRTRLQAKFESVPFFTLAEQDAAINEALQWYNLYTGVWRQRTEMTTVADQVYYALPGHLVWGARVEFNGYPLALSSLSDLDNGQPGWEAQTTASGGTIPTRPQVWAPVGMTTIALWPADADGENGLIFDGVFETPTLSVPTDYVDLDDTELDALLGEALYLLCMKDPGRIQRVSNWHENFLANVVAHSRRLRAANAFLSAEGTNALRATVPLSVKR
jgi:hypothetical protein